MLCEASIITPIFNIDENLLREEEEWITRTLLDKFSGLTTQSADAWWVNPATGRLCKDPFRRYTFAADIDQEDIEQVITETAKEIGERLNQEDIYVVFPSGEVKILEVELCATQE